MARDKQDRARGRTDARISDWRGLLAGESRRAKLSVLAIMTLVASSMTFMQLGFIGIGTDGEYSSYVLALLGPIAITVLLLGRGWGTLYGLLCGAILYAHAQVQPLDLYERYIVSPLNSLGLYTTVALMLGILFSIALRNEPRGARRVGYVTLVCLIASLVATSVFIVNTLTDAIYATVVADELAADMPRDVELALNAVGNVVIQGLCDFFAMLVLCLLTDFLVAKYQEERSYMSVLSLFRANLLVIAVIVFMVVQSAAFVVITMQLETVAKNEMDSEIDFVADQLLNADKYFTDLLEMPEFGKLSDEAVHSILDGVSMDKLIEGYDIDVDGTLVIFWKDAVLFSDSPAYARDTESSEVFGVENANLLDELAESGEMRKMIYITRPMQFDEDGFVTVDSVYGASAYQLGYMRAKKFGDYHIMMAMPASMVFEERYVTVNWASALAFLLLLVIYQVAARLLRKAMVEPIVRTNASLAEITSGKLDTPVTETGSVELAMLSAGINTTVETLKDHIHEAERRNEQDLATAKTIQESALPRTFPPFPEIEAFDIYASMDAAKEVGGDFYDFFLVDDHTLAFLIADVSGKGIPGALFMMAAKTELENYLSTGMAPAEAIASANRRLCRGNEAGMFVTVWAATLDWESGLLTYVNAGHNFPLLRHGAGGSWEWLSKKCGLFLGTFETAKYRQETLTLRPGDELLLYTDGVNEAFDADEQEYGNDRLEAFLAAHDDLRAQEMVQSLRADVAAWAEGAEQSDDITILALEYGISSEATASRVVPATLDNLRPILQLVDEELERRLCPQSVQRKVEVALEELFVNVCSYAYADLDEPGEVVVSYTYSADPSTISIELRDAGVPFDPVKRADPTMPSSIQETSIGGLGILMVKKTMDELSYRREAGDNVVTFRKSW